MRTRTISDFGKAGFTQREIDVLYWIARGKSNLEIGEILKISPATVKKHLEHIYKKLGVKNRLTAAISAWQIDPRTSRLHGPRSSR